MMCFVVWKAVAAAVRNSTMGRGNNLLFAWAEDGSVLHSGWIPVVTSQLTAAWVDSTWNVAISTKPVSLAQDWGPKAGLSPGDR